MKTENLNYPSILTKIKAKQRQVRAASERTKKKSEQQLQQLNAEKRIDELEQTITGIHEDKARQENHEIFLERVPTKYRNKSFHQKLTRALGGRLSQQIREYTDFLASSDIVNITEELEELRKSNLELEKLINKSNKEIEAIKKQRQEIEDQLQRSEKSDQVLTELVRQISTNFDGSFGSISKQKQDAVITLQQLSREYDKETHETREQLTKYQAKLRQQLDDFKNKTEKIEQSIEKENDVKVKSRFLSMLDILKIAIKKAEAQLEKIDKELKDLDSKKPEKLIETEKQIEALQEKLDSLESSFIPEITERYNRDFIEI